MGVMTVQTDTNVFRFGTQSLKVTTGDTGDNAIYPDTPVAVIPGEYRTMSAYIRTNAPITGGAIHLRVAQAGLLTPLLADSIAITDSSTLADVVDGFARVSCSFLVPEGVFEVRPFIRYTGTTAGQVFWVDGSKFEKGDKASVWQENIVSGRTVLDQMGLMVDAFRGGILRLIGALGGARDSVSLGDHGLVFGGDTEVYSDAAGHIRVPKLRITDAVDVNLSSTNHSFQIGPTNGANLAMEADELQARDNGAAADFFLNNAGGAVHTGGPLSVDGELDLVTRTTVSSTGTVNDLSPGTGTQVRFTSASDLAVTGFSGFAEGRMLVVFNASSAIITLQHENAGSTAANRIICPGSLDCKLGPGGAAVLVYETVSDRWRVVSATGVSLQRANRNWFVAGSTTITPVANTPTSNTISSLGLSGSFLSAWATANTSVIGGAVSGASYANPSTSSIDIYVYRSNTTNTAVGYGVMSS